jgi:hypothetical protein
MPAIALSVAPAKRATVSCSERFVSTVSAGVDPHLFDDEDALLISRHDDSEGTEDDLVARRGPARALEGADRALAKIVEMLGPRG